MERCLLYLHQSNGSLKYLKVGTYALAYENLEREREREREQS
jgi:hypothetical protein